MIIQNIGDLLPKSFDAKIRYVNLKSETLKSCREFVVLILLAFSNFNHLESKAYQYLFIC